MSNQVLQTVSFDVPPSVVFDALTKTEHHAEFTGGKSEIDATEGGYFSGHDGQIVGRNLELVSNERIVQAWRVTAWPEGVYSVVQYHLSKSGAGCELSLTHTGLPDGAAEMIAEGWEQRYWTPMRAYFSK